MILRLLLATVTLVNLQILAQEDEPQGIDSEDGEAEEFYNKTYIEHQTALERTIFQGYQRTQRPVRNVSTPTPIDVHWHIVHANIDQKQQTLNLHGHLYMTWIDELLGWDPDDYNGIRISRAKKWQVWHPKIKVANSVSGVYSNFEISTHAHVLIQTIGKDRGAKIEMYPTFSIKVGCSFDYSDYPYDENRCSISIFTPQKMNEVVLRVYGMLPPTLMFGWGEQASKRIISDFEITNVTNALSFFRHGNVTDLEPITAMEAATTWSVMRTTVHLRRHSVMYTVGLLLPCIVSITFNLLPYLLPSIPQALYAIIANIILQAVFLQDLVGSLPLVVSSIPKAVVLYGEIMTINAISLACHLVFLMMTTQTSTPPQPLQLLLRVKGIAPRKGEDITGPLSWIDIVNILRTTTAVLLAIAYFASFLFFIVF